MKVLAEIISELESGSRPKGGVTSEGDIPSLGAEHLDNDGGFYFKNVKRVSKEFFHSLKSGKLSINDILIVKDGATTGKVSYLSEEFPFAEASINEHVFRIQINDKVAVPKYVFHFLKSEIGNRQIMADFRGATVGGISRKFTDGVRILLPPLEDQQRISTILDHADSIRRKNRQILEKYNELAQSVFYEMFGDPDSNPKGFPIVRFDSVGKIDRGVSKHRPRNAPELLGGNHPLIQTGDVANSQLFIKEFDHTYSDLGLAQSKLWPMGTLCITIAANIGKSGILGFNTCFPDSVVGFIPNRTSDAIYIHYWLSCIQKRLEKSAPESAQKNINLKILRELELPLPQIGKQKEFSQIIYQIESQKELTQKSLEKSEDLFQSLLQRAFRGEL